MALAVSLWIAGGSMASAGIVYIDANDNIVNGSISATATAVPGIGNLASDKILTLTGDLLTGNYYGGFGNGAVNSYQLILDNANISYGYAIGGYSTATNNAENNVVKIKNSNVAWVLGGMSSYGNAKKNTVELINSTAVTVTGGTGNGGYATDNSVYMTDSKVTETVEGGDSGNAVIDKVSGNTLYLAGANTIGGNVSNFEKIYITEAKFGTPALILNGSIKNNPTIDASKLTFVESPETIANGATMNLISGTVGDVSLVSTTTSKKAYTLTPVTGVTVDAALQGILSIPTTKNALVCTAANIADKVTFNGAFAWNLTAPYYDVTNTPFAFDGTTAIDASNLTFTGLDQTVKTGDAMTLLSNATGITGDHITQSTKTSYEYELTPLTGLMINGAVTGQIAVNSGNVNYQVTGNNATKLTFTDVEWKDSGALLNHATTLSNVFFNGAAVDTTKINFTNIKELAANKKMILVSDFGSSVGTITGSKYTVGTGLEGEGKASLDGTNLIFTAKTGTDGKLDVTAQEQTHNTVMGAEVGMAALSAGNDFVGAATEGLSMAGNTGTDGMATYANMGGGSMNVETGSHVKTHTWNAILALGHKNEKKLSTTEYGAFFEYGKGNYTTFNGDERGDGSTHYTGGGILGKWQKNNDGLYVEGSLRVGSIHDDASNVLRDAARNPYSYNTDATYWGAHIGVGKELKVNTTDILDIYAKYFYNHRGSVAFDAAGNHYDLNAVESSVLRVGTRYTVKKDDKFNYYGGLALEHEFCGRAAGFVDGVAIRGADISGTSVRGEIGATFRPGEKSNVTLDLNLSGFAGKKQGLTGGLSAVFHI